MLAAQQEEKGKVSIVEEAAKDAADIPGTSKVIGSSEKVDGAKDGAKDGEGEVAR